MSVRHNISLYAGDGTRGVTAVQLGNGQRRRTLCPIICQYCCGIFIPTALFFKCLLLTAVTNPGAGHRITAQIQTGNQPDAGLTLFPPNGDVIGFALFQSNVIGLNPMFFTGRIRQLSAPGTVQAIAVIHNRIGFCFRPAILVDERLHF